MVCDQEHGIVVTVDSTGLVKTWQGGMGVELASYAVGSPHCSLLHYTINNRSFLSVRGGAQYQSTSDYIDDTDNHAQLTYFSV